MYTHNLNWKLLKQNKCPKCKKDWAFNLTVDDGMLEHKCGFKIREFKYKQIISNQVNMEIEENAEGGENNG